MVRSLVCVGSIIRLVYHQPGVTLKCPAFEQHKGNSDETMCRCERGFILFQCSYFYADVLIYIHVTWATLFIGFIPYFYFIRGIWSHLIYILFVHFLILTCYYHVQGPSFFYFYLSIWCFLNVCFPKFVVITCGQPIWENIKKREMRRRVTLDRLYCGSQFVIAIKLTRSLKNDP